MTRSLSRVRNLQALRRLHRPRRHLARRRARASSSASSGPRAAARPPCCAPSPGLDPQTSGTIRQKGRDVSALPPAAARLRHRLPVLRAVSQPHRHRQCRLRAGQPPPGARRDRASASTSCWRWSACPMPGRNIPRSSRAASSSAWRWPARSRPRPACCCSTSRSRRSMRACALRLRARDQGAAAPPRRHHHHGDARPGGGAHHGRPHRGDEPGRDRAGRHAAGDLPPAGDGLRRRLRGHDEFPARHACWRRTGSRSAASPSTARRRTGWRRAARSRSASGPRTCACATCRPTSPIASPSRSPSSISSAPSAAPR